MIALWSNLLVVNMKLRLSKLTDVIKHDPTSTSAFVIYFWICFTLMIIAVVLALWWYIEKKWRRRTEEPEVSEEMDLKPVYRKLSAPYLDLDNNKNLVLKNPEDEQFDAPHDQMYVETINMPPPPYYYQNHTESFVPQTSEQEHVEYVQYYDEEPLFDNDLYVDTVDHPYVLNNRRIVSENEFSRFESRVYRDINSREKFVLLPLKEPLMYDQVYNEEDPLSAEMYLEPHRRLY